MADLRVIFKINEYGNGVVNSITSNAPQNNISKYPYSTMLTRKDEHITLDAKYEGYVLGTSTFASDQVIDENYPGYMFSAVTDNDGNCELVVELYGNDILSLIFTFDVFLGQYPTHYRVLDSNGIETYYTNDTANPYVISITKLVAGANATKRITFYKWSKPNYNVLIKDIESIEVDIELNKHFIKELEYTSQMTSDGTSINYGILANTGKLKINDYNGVIYNSAKLGYLDAYVYNLYSYLNGNQIQQNISVDAPYYSQENQLEINLTNNISNWNSVNFNERTYGTGTNLYQVLLDAMRILGYSDSDVELMTNNIINVSYIGGGMTNNEELSVKEYLQSITFDECTIDKTNVADILNSICTVAQLFIYADNEGNIKFANARPLASSSEETLLISYKNQRTHLEYDMVVANRYDSAEIGN